MGKKLGIDMAMRVHLEHESRSSGPRWSAELFLLMFCSFLRGINFGASETGEEGVYIENTY